MTQGIFPQLITIEIEPAAAPDRSEFWRDMDACRRAHSPMAAARFAYSLIRRQAEIETFDAMRRGVITHACGKAPREQVIRYLWREATALGLLNPTPYRIEMRTTMRTAEPDESYRRRIMDVACAQGLKSSESYELATATGYDLDAIGARHNVARAG